MPGRIIALRNGEPEAGRRTVAESLASHWHGENQAVLWITIDETPGRQTLELVPRIKDLSPLLARNYLSDPRGSYARLSLSGWPVEAHLSGLLTLVRAAFDWVLVTAPQTLSLEEIELLDGCDLALWVL